MSTPGYPLFCIGQPLLDIQVTDGEKLLEKYSLRANDGILADDKHLAIYDEITTDYAPVFVAGGAAQNTARGAAYVLPPDSVVFTGCVGDDGLAEQLKAANSREGLKDAYLVARGEKTGACAVVITGHNRSLVTTLRAAEKFQRSHLLSDTVAPLVDGAKVFYMEGYMLTHNVSCALYLGEKASTLSKTFVLNLSAPRIPQALFAELEQVIPYCDIIIGNEAEAEAWGTAAGMPSSKDIAAVAKTLALLPKANASRPRTVIITHGPHSTILVSSLHPEHPQSFLVHPLSEDRIVDTNGAGDAFAGGFLGALVLGRPMEECVAIGHRLGAMCVQQVGPQYQWPKISVI
ncbi:Ribokinase-like protein [Athelia psychrophila]|uniref:Adenosine kinase n=1 Tax=Athelia psychrophila TaxID=1759441 RepID=A0A166G1R5_9AGAM|nr:Ribokinase-like protein [Fibularhizoctonia sp. CBS 109695]